MQKALILTTISLLALSLATPLGSAAHGCNGVIITVSAGPETLYIDDRSSDVGQINHWFYLESNNMDDLQTGGDNVIFEDGPLGTFSDPCAHTSADTLLL